MARNLCIVVGDDFTLQQNAKTWGQDNGVTVVTYSVSQWESGLENSNFRSQIHLEPVTLNAGHSNETLNGGTGGKVLPFPNLQPQVDSKRVHTFEEMESEAIKQAIMEFRGNLTEAAKALGIGRATLYRKVKQYSIDPSVARGRGKQAA
jgi:DNA-binding NtrC family response regulator